MDETQRAIMAITEILHATPMHSDPMIAEIMAKPARRPARPSAASSRHKVARGLRVAEKIKRTPSAAQMRGKL